MTPTELLKTEEAIRFVKEQFSAQLASRLQLSYVSAPLAVLEGTGINDDLNGTERAVGFPIKAQDERRAVVVHSLAKWKRLRLHEYGIAAGSGILTDMRALRPDEDYTALHSVYVDQWDWEQRMHPDQRRIDFLKATVQQIYEALRETESQVARLYGIDPVLPEAVHFIHAEALRQAYPQLDAKERENEVTRQYGAVFIIGIGGKLGDGQAHDGRAPDYDDWSTTNEEGFAGLNGDLLVWHPKLQRAFELSSMGIRVDREALLRQLKERDCEDRKELSYHRLLLAGTLPQSIGGGIGQSRVCMFLLRKSHIGEVQVSIWPEAEREKLVQQGIRLL